MPRPYFLLPKWIFRNVISVHIDQAQPVNAEMYKTVWRAPDRSRLRSMPFNSTPFSGEELQPNSWIEPQVPSDILVIERSARLPSSRGVNYEENLLCGRVTSCAFTSVGRFDPFFSPKLTFNAKEFPAATRVGCRPRICVGIVFWAKNRHIFFGINICAPCMQDGYASANGPPVSSTSKIRVSNRSCGFRSSIRPEGQLNVGCSVNTAIAGDSRRLSAQDLVQPDSREEIRFEFRLRLFFRIYRGAGG